MGMNVAVRSESTFGVSPDLPLVRPLAERVNLRNRFSCGVPREEEMSFDFACPLCESGSIAFEATFPIGARSIQWGGVSCDNDDCEKTLTVRWERTP